MSSNASDAMPADLLPLIETVTETSNKATSFLQTSRFFLSHQVLRDHFPRTWDTAINTDFSAHAVPVPGDNLGSGRLLEPDHLEQFAWPIELGMASGIPHLVIFGRSLVEEYAERYGLRWKKVIQ